MSSIPFHDDQLIPPERSLPPQIASLSPLQRKLLENAFFSERDRVFTPAMEEETLVAFYRKYQIAFPLPWIGGKRNINFWVMTYTAALCNKAGPPPETGEPHLPGDQLLSATTIKAEIWLYRSQAARNEKQLSPISWNVKQGVYSINGKVYSIHPLLKVKRGESYVQFLPRKPVDS